MKLTDAVEGQEYVIRQIDTDDEEMNAFLFSLGCYSGEKITVISHIKGGTTLTSNWPTRSSSKQQGSFALPFSRRIS